VLSGYPGRATPQHPTRAKIVADCGLTPGRPTSYITRFVPRCQTPLGPDPLAPVVPGDEHKITHPQNPPKQGGPPTTKPQVKGRIHRITPEEPLDRPAAADPLRRSRPFPTAFEPVAAPLRTPELRPVRRRWFDVLNHLSHLSHLGHPFTDAQSDRSDPRSGLQRRGRSRSHEAQAAGSQDRHESQKAAIRWEHAPPEDP
jgi:hypothetical protein